MPDDQQLSQQDMQDLQSIATKLPTGHPMQAKLNTLLNSQPTQFEKERQNAPKTTGEVVKRAVSAPLTSDFWSQAGTAAKNLVGGAMNLSGDPGKIASNAVETGKQFATEDLARKGQNRSLPYRAVAAAGSAMGVPAAQMEHQADIGSPEGIVGAAAPITAATLAPHAMKVAKAGLESAPVQAITKGGPVRALGEAYTIGMPGEAMLKKGISPRARATGYDAAVERAKGDIVRYHQETPITSAKDFNEAIPQIKENVWKEEVEPALQRQSKRPVDMAPVAAKVREQITPEMKEFDETGANQLNDMADKLEKSRDVESSNRLLRYANSKLESYFAKYPSARNSNLMNNPETAGWESARRELRNQFLATLEDAGESGVRDARLRYGALEDIGKEVERRVNVADRQKPMSLSRILGIMGAPATGGLSVAAGELAHHLNKPDVLIRRGIEKMTRENPEALLPRREATPEPYTPPAPPAPPALPPALPESVPPRSGPPPAVSPQFAQEAIGSVQDATKLGTRGQAGIRIPEQKLLPAPPEPVNWKGENTPIASAPETKANFNQQAMQSAKNWMEGSKEPAARPEAAPQRGPLDKEFTPEQIADAEGLIKSELGMMESADRPGRYFDEYAKGEQPTADARNIKEGERYGGKWRGVGSMRPMLTFMKEWTGTPSALRKAMERGEGPLYTQAMRRAAEIIKSENARRSSAQ